MTNQHVTVTFPPTPATVVVATGVPGAPGREVELQATATHLQWRYAGSTVWTNLVPVEDLRGPKGDTGNPALVPDDSIPPAKVSGLVNALQATVTVNDPRLSDARTPTAHTHTMGDVSGLGTELSKKVDNTDPRLSDPRTPLAHGHTLTDITGLQTSLDEKVSTTDTRLTDARTPLPHEHSVSDVVGLPEVMDQKVDTTDPRLSNARTPTSHTHEIEDVAGLQDALDDTVSTEDPRLTDARTPKAHTHGVTDVSGLQGALDQKADVAHTHNLSDTVGLAGLLSEKANTSDPRLSDSRTPTAHTHAIADVTGLQDALVVINDEGDGTPHEVYSSQKTYNLLMDGLRYDGIDPFAADYVRRNLGAAGFNDLEGVVMAGVEQTFTDEEKAFARANISAVSVTEVDSAIDSAIEPIAWVASPDTNYVWGSFPVYVAADMPNPVNFNNLPVLWVRTDETTGVPTDLILVTPEG